MYQSRYSLSLELRACLNHSCWLLVWLNTMSRTSFMPRSWSLSRSASTCSRLP